MSEIIGVKRRHPTPFAGDASKNWSDQTIADCPDVHEISEYPDIEALMLYASSSQGNDYLSVSEESEERCNLFQQPVKIIIRTYIQNILPTFDGSAPKDKLVCVKVKYRHDPVSEMLVTENVLTASRVYPYSDKMKFPFSISQLPKVIRNVALCRTQRQ